MPSVAAIHYERSGAGEPMLLIHGIGSNLRCWETVVPELSRHNDVIAIDLPGHDHSPPPPAGTHSTVPVLASRVEALLDELGLDTVHIVGNSMGGWIALELARRHRARSVVAISPAGLGTDAENRRSKVILTVLRWTCIALQGQIDRLARFVVFRVLLYALIAGRPWRITPDALAYTIKGVVASPGFPATLDWLFDHSPTGLHEITVPVIVLWGSRDMILSPKQGPRFEAAIPGAFLRPLPGLGHLPMSDDPELVSQLILRGVARAPVATRSETSV